jgi:uncharacterized secreted protein with C-terminal beta-propeller domain
MIEERNKIIVLGTIFFIIGFLITIIAPAVAPTQPYQPRSITMINPATIYRTVTYTEKTGGGVYSYSELIDKIMSQAKFFATGVTALPAAMTAVSEAIPLVTPVSAVSSSGDRGVYPEVSSLGYGKTFSKTNVQVEGVDEQDIVKTNGEIIVVTKPDRKNIAVINVSSDQVASYIKIDQDYVVRGLYLVNNTLVIISSQQIYRILVYPSPPIIEKTRIYIYDLSDLSRPVEISHIDIDGGFSGSRLVNSYLYIVTNMPSFSFSGGNISPVIPSVNGSPIPLSNIIDTGLYLNFVNILTYDLVKNRFDVKTVTGGFVEWIYMKPDKLYLVWRDPLVYIDVIYRLIDQLYMNRLISEENLTEIMNMIKKGDLMAAHVIINNIINSIPRDKLSILKNISTEVVDKTIFNVFNIDGLNITWSGSFRVAGHILDQFAMEEFENKGSRYIIVATTVSKIVVEPLIYPIITLPVVITETYCNVSYCGNATTTPMITSREYVQNISRVMITFIPRVSEAYNNVYIVDEKLRIVSVIEGLAPGERIYAARLLKNIFYLVTFRNVDPLYAIDISDPYKPVVLGFLKTPGFSEYLHPISNDLLLGVGLETSLGRSLKISLYDISDPKNLKISSEILLQGGSSPVLNDHHAFTLDSRHNLVIIPGYAMINGSPATVFIIKYNIDQKKIELIKHLYIVGASRSLYIDDKLYIIGSDIIMILKLPSLEELKTINY